MRPASDGRVALGVDEVDRGEDGVHPLGELVAAGDAVGGVVGAELALGPHDALGHRGLGHEERPGDLGCLEPSEEAQGERHLGVRRQGWVAAEEHQPQLVVCDDVDQVVEVDQIGVGVRFHVVGVETAGRQVPLVTGGLAAQPVDRPVAGGRGDPTAWVGRHAVGRPALSGDRERLSDRVLGEVDVAEDADQGGGAAARLTAEDLREVLSHPPAWAGAPRRPRMPVRNGGSSRERRRGLRPR